MHGAAANGASGGGAAVVSVVMSLLMSSAGVNACASGCGTRSAGTTGGAGSGSGTNPRSAAGAQGGGAQGSGSGSGNGDDNAGGGAKAGPKAPTCTADPTFSGLFQLPEASAAAEVELSPGTRELLVLSDSGQKGAALAYALPAGPARSLTLPLDPAAGDDTEGVAWRNGILYILTSSGGVDEMKPDGKGGVTRLGAAYPIGKPPLVCADLDDGNCGKNFEGLCLRGAGRSARCAGYAASKAEGALYCVVIERDPHTLLDHLAIDRILPPTRLALPKHALSDCAFGSEDGPAAGVLLVSTNVHDGSTVYVVDEKSGALAPIDVGGLPNDEAIAVDHTGALYQAMDDNSSPSPALRASCNW